jgi:hypothetical protein
MNAEFGIMPGMGGDIFMEGTIEPPADKEDGGDVATEFGDGAGDVQKDEPRVFWRKSLSIFCNLNRFLLRRKEPFSNMVRAFGCRVQ